jgi:hypothetical protein
MSRITLNTNNIMGNDYLSLQEVEQKIAETRRKHLEGEMTEGLRIMYLAQIRIDIQTLWKKEEIPPKKAEELWDRARAVLDEKPSNVNAGFDPEIFTNGTKLTMFYIGTGAGKFKDFAELMINELGEKIKPYLKSFYIAAKYIPGMEEYSKSMDSFDYVSNFNIDNIGKNNSREEEVKRRIQEWEQKNNKNLKNCSRKEWIEAMQGIMAMTRQETEEYLDHLMAQKNGF